MIYHCQRVTFWNIVYVHIASQTCTFPIPQEWVFSRKWCFPICWKGLSSLLGSSTDLLNSCVQGAYAKTLPSTVHRGVPGINMYPTLQVTEAPLLNKGDTVEK